jgi:hypothetical protein
MSEQTSKAMGVATFFFFFDGDTSFYFSFLERERNTKGLMEALGS